jgi:hypothetical protein
MCVFLCVCMCVCVCVSSRKCKIKSQRFQYKSIRHIPGQNQSNDTPKYQWEYRERGILFHYWQEVKILQLLWSLTDFYPVFVCDGFFCDRISWTICPGCLWTIILLISAFRVARTRGVSHHQHPFTKYVLAKWS